MTPTYALFPEIAGTFTETRLSPDEAVFYSAAEVGDLLRGGGFVARAWGQTLFRPPPEIEEVEPVRPGTGRGAFVVVTADRADHAEVREDRAGSTPSSAPSP